MRGLVYCEAQSQCESEIDSESGKEKQGDDEEAGNPLYANLVSLFCPRVANENFNLYGLARTRASSGCKERIVGLGVSKGNIDEHLESVPAVMGVHQ